MTNRFPPHVLILLAITSIQIGAGLATSLFPVLGAEGTVAIRILISALLLMVAARMGITKLLSQLVVSWKILFVFGGCIAAMNLFFYQSIARIPLGAAVAFEFIGPLGVAAFNSRKIGQLLWVALAGFGIFLLSPVSGMDLDPVGIVFALLAGTGWAMFIIVSQRVSSLIPGNDGLVVAMVIAALILFPFAIPALPILVVDPIILATGIGVAVLSTTIPFTLEFVALKRLSKRAYGVLVGVEPAVAALVGALLLSERIGVQGAIAVACVVMAAIGVTISEGRSNSD